VPLRGHPLLTALCHSVIYRHEYDGTDTRRNHPAAARYPERKPGEKPLGEIMAAHKRKEKKLEEAKINSLK